jgi:hypothetical protein
LEAAARRAFTDNPILQAKDRGGIFFYYLRAYKDLALACRLPTAGYWWQSGSEIKGEFPDEIDNIRRIARLERCEPDKNTGFSWRFA